MAEKEAFCDLLWIYNGRLIQGGKRINGYCDKPYDCYLCPVMHHKVAQHPPGYANWVCPSCLREVAKRAKTEGKPIEITGHYTEGRCQYIGCSRPPRIEHGDVLGPDETSWTDADLVERPSGYSRLLQLVIGDINS